MERYLFFIACLLMMDCASKINISRNVTTIMRRMPQMNRIETADIIKRGDFSVSIDALYALKKPGFMMTTDSTCETHSDFIGNEFTIITASKTACFESRYMISGEGAYAFTDVVSGGVSLDASLGSIKYRPQVESNTIKNDNIEGSIFMRLAKRYNRITIAIKPEICIANIYGDHIFREKTQPNDTTVITATDRINCYYMAVRSSSVLRIGIAKGVSLFSGFQVKTQPFFSQPLTTENDLAYGIYGGFAVQIKKIQCAPMVTLPLGSTTGHFKSPLSGGMHFSYRFTDR